MLNPYILEDLFLKFRFFFFYLDNIFTSLFVRESANTLCLDIQETFRQGD